MNGLTINWKKLESNVKVIKDIKAATGLSEATIRSVFTGLLVTLKANVDAGQPTVIPGVGTLKVKRRNARTGRNPATGAAMEVEAHGVLDFTPTGDMRTYTWTKGATE